MKRLLAVRERLTPPVLWRWPLAIGSGLLSGMVWALIALLIDTQSVRGAFAGLAAPQLWLTALFLGLLVLAISLLTHSFFVGNLAVGAVVVLISFANYFKVLITAVPLSIGNLALIGQVGDIAALNSDSLILGRNSILAILAAVFWALLALFFSGPLRLEWRRSALGGGAAALLFVLVFAAGADPLFYTPLGVPMERIASQQSVNQSCGVLLGLWRSFLQQATRDLGKDYSRAHMEDVAAEILTLTENQSVSQKDVQPNVILILSESFFDVTGLDNVTFEEDPAAEFHALKEEGVSGRFYTRMLGQGTVNVELEVLTGLNTGLLSGEDLYDWPADVFSRLPAVPAVFRDNGYYTAMIHLFNDSIYHRSDFLGRLGFDGQYFSPDFAAIYDPAAQAADYWAYMNEYISGEYFSDALMTDLLISLYERHDADGPVFFYGISMENHASYVDKYGEEELTVSPKSPLTGEAANDLRNLSQGVHNASAALGRLTDYFRTVDEPTVIVFFGDHRPGLGLWQSGGGGTVYSELGMVSADSGQWSLEDIAGLYSTDYLIWSNDPDCLPGEPGSTLDTSCNYLGALLLDTAGVEKPVYWRLISYLSQYRVIDTPEYHLGTAGELTANPPDSGAAARGLSLLTDIINDAVYGKQYVTGILGGSG